MQYKFLPQNRFWINTINKWSPQGKHLIISLVQRLPARYIPISNADRFQMRQSPHLQRPLRQVVQQTRPIREKFTQDKLFYSKSKRHFILIGWDRLYYTLYASANRVWSVANSSSLRVCSQQTQVCFYLTAQSQAYITCR